MSRKNKEIYDVIIIGKGPAGLEAAIYTATAKLKTLVLGKKENSRLFKAGLISNYFGFPKGITGKELLERGIEQAKNCGAILKEEEVIDIFPEEDKFVVKTVNKEYLGKSILLATGVQNNLSGITKENNFIGKGISFCVACDGSYFKNKKVGVLGNGDFAAKEALELKEFTNDITLYSNGKKFKLSKEFQKKLKENNINFDKDKIKEFFGKEKLEGIVKENNQKVALDGMFIALGSPKASDFSYKLGLEIFNDYVVCDRNGKTNVSGIFAAGDVIGSNLQVSSAVGSASIAAFSIISYIRGKEKK